AIVSATITGTSGNTSQLAHGLTASAAMPQVVAAVVAPPVSRPGQSVTLAGVFAATGSLWVKPTGMVLFLDNGVPIGAAPLNSAGVAVFVTSSLASGTHAIKVVYSGDTLYRGVTSAPTIATVL